MVSKDDQGLIVTLITNVVVGTIVFLLFCFLRTRIPRVFSARSLNGLWAPAFGDGFFSWIPVTLRTRERELFQHGVGIEQVMFLRWLFTMGVLAFLFFVSSFAIIVPLNATGPNQHLNNTNTSSVASFWVTGLLVISMSNRATIPGAKASSVLWVHLVLVFVFAIAVLVLLTRDWQQFLRFRLVQRADHELPSNFAVLVRDVPAQLNQRALDDAALFAYFDGLYPGRVRGVTRPWAADKVYRRMIKYNDTYRAMELAEATFAEEHKEPEMRTGPLGLVGGKVLSRVYLAGRTAHYRGTVEAAQNEAAAQPLAGRHALVLFSDTVSAALCARALHHAPRGEFLTEQAPEPSAVCWQNMGCGSWPEGFIRNAAVMVFIVLLVFLWAIPVGFAASLANLSHLADRSGFHWLHSVLKVSPVITGLLSGLLPVLVVVVFFALLPMIIRAVAAQRRPLSWPQLDRWCRNYLFAFLLVNVFLVYTLSGSFLFRVNDFVTNVSFSKIVSLLATSLPGQALFFSNLMMTRAFMGAPLLLLRPADLLVQTLKLRLLAKTERARREILRAPPPTLHWQYANVAILALIALVYAIMFPLVLFFALAAFWLLWLVCKYNVLAVWHEPYGSRGELWPGGFHVAMVGLYVYELTMLGVLLTYRFYPAPVIVVLFFGTIFYHVHMVRRYSAHCKYGALDAHNAPPPTAGSAVELQPVGAAAPKVVPEAQYAAAVPAEPRARLPFYVQPEKCAVPADGLIDLGWTD